MPDRLFDAENTHQVFGWLWTSGQLSAEDIRSFPALGIDAVVNLALPTSSNALPGEAEMVTSLGMAYVQIPVVWERPRLDDFTLLVRVLGALQGKNVWLHCAKNMRVSAFVYLFRRIVLAQDHEASSFPLDEVWEPDGVWREFMDAVLAAHTIGSAGE